MRLVAGLIPALTEEAVTKLVSAGVTNILKFLDWDLEALAEETDISYPDLKNIKEIIIAKNAAIPITGADMLDIAKKCTSIISTGNKSLDTLLGGGLMTGEIVEICGAGCSGKTMLCLYMALHCALKLEHHVLYMDFAANVSKSRINSILENMEFSDENIEGALSRLKIVQPRDYISLVQTLESLCHSTSHKKTKIFGSNESKGKQIKLLVVDSVYSYFHHLKSKSLAEMGYLNQLTSCLKKLSVDHHVAVITVNNTREPKESSIDSKETGRSSCSELIPALGLYWAHIPNTRLHVKLLRKKQPEVTLSSSNEGSTSEVPSSSSPSLVPSFSMDVIILKSSRLKIDATEIKLFNND